MAFTAESAVSSILQEILVQSSEQKIEAVDAITALDYMNLFMTEQDAIGISIGYTEVDSLSDNITIPAGARGGLIFGTAVRLLSSYDVIPNAQLLINADLGLNAMRKLARKPRFTVLPDTLPIGSGNHSFLTRRRFFPGEEASVLNESNGHVLLEDSTNG